MPFKTWMETRSQHLEKNECPGQVRNVRSGTALTKDFSRLADVRVWLDDAEYERLKTGDMPAISIGSFDELAEGLIKARIAAGLSQKVLAGRIGLKEQQIQRYEAERCASASYQPLRDISTAVGVRIRNDILLPVTPGNFNGLVEKLRQVGLDRDFLLSRFLSSADAARAAGEAPSEDEDILSAKAGAALERVFGSTRDNLFGAQPLAAPRFAAAEARFKMPAGRAQAANRSLCRLRQLSGGCRAEHP